MEVQDAQDVLRMLDKANVFRTCGTFTVCEDKLLNSCSGISNMGQKNGVYLPDTCPAQGTDQVPLLYSGVCPYSEGICDMQKSVSFAIQVSLHLPEAQKSRQT